MTLRGGRERFFTFNKARHDVDQFFQLSSDEMYSDYPRMSSLLDIEPMAPNEDLQHVDSPRTDVPGTPGGGHGRGEGAGAPPPVEESDLREASPKGPDRAAARRQLQNMKCMNFSGDNPLLTKSEASAKHVLRHKRQKSAETGQLPTPPRKSSLSASQALPNSTGLHPRPPPRGKRLSSQSPSEETPSQPLLKPGLQGWLPQSLIGPQGLPLVTPVAPLPFDLSAIPAGVGAKFEAGRAPRGGPERQDSAEDLRNRKKQLLMQSMQGSSQELARSKVPKRAPGMHPLLAAKQAINDSIDKQRQLAKDQCKRNNVLFVDDVGFEEMQTKMAAKVANITQEELVENLKRPTEFTRYKLVGGKVRKRQVQLMMDNTGTELICMDVKGTKSLRIQLLDVTELRKGQKTKTFENSKEAGERILLSFSLVYGDRKDLNLVAKNSRKFDIWVEGLIGLISYCKEQDTEMGAVRMAWDTEAGEAETVTYKQICSMLYKLNMKASSKSIKRTIRADDPSKLDKMTFQDFVVLIHDLRYRKEIDSIFSAYASHSNQMRDSEVLQFLMEDQKEYDMDLAKVQQLLLPFKTKSNPFFISRSGFADFVTSKINHVFNPDTAVIYQEMTRPLTDYFVFSSHNTYLEGNQISGYSSSDMYCRVLKAGCRCVELDCWDGDDGEPIIFHGHTLTTRIKFEDACIAIRDYAFFASDYPVILSLENHCCIEQQKRMAEIMKMCFGASIAMPLDPRTYDKIHLPSPKQLKKKIIIKGKTLMTHYELNADGTIRKESKMKVATELSDITFLKSVAYADCAQFQELEEASDSEPPNPKPWEICSFSELALKNLDKQQLVEFNKTNFSRIYPKGSRIESSNYSAHPFWSHGCQLVALNLQTMGKVSWANTGRFKDNGGCGYVLKPPEMLHDFRKPFDPAEFPNDSSRPPIKLKIEILSARQLPKSSRKKGDIVNPFVTASIVGMTCDSKSKSTKVVKANGFNPYWGKTVEFDIYMPEMATLLFLIYDEDTFASLHGRFKIAYYSIPVTCIKEGYRIMELFDETGKKCPMSDLFCRFQFSHDSVSGDS